MTKEEKERYDEYELLGDILKRVLAGRKFRLHCWHHVTFGQYLGNDVTICNGKEYKLFSAIAVIDTIGGHAADRKKSTGMKNSGNTR